MKLRLSALCLLFFALCIGGCTVGPHYARSGTDTPPAYRGADDSQGSSAPRNPESSVVSFGDEKWAEVFRDPTLQGLIREALANNYDVKIAAERVLEQQDQVGITRSQEFPTVSGGGNYTAIGLPGSLASTLNQGRSTSFATRYYSGGFTLSTAWNLDFC